MYQTTLTFVGLAGLAIAAMALLEVLFNKKLQDSRYGEWYVISGKIGVGWSAWAKWGPMFADTSQGPLWDNAAFVTGGWSTRREALASLRKNISSVWIPGEGEA